MIPFRYVWQGLIMAIGIAIIVLGALQVTKNPWADRGFICLGAATVLEMIYLMIRRVPRFDPEEDRTAKEESIDTVACFAILGLGILAAVIAGAVR